jgi:hypothetical protein
MSEPHKEKSSGRMSALERKPWLLGLLVLVVLIVIFGLMFVVNQVGGGPAPGQ